MQSINCIRSGQVLLDENLQLFLLCTNCHRDARSLPEFRRHLENCEGIEKYFQKPTKLKYSSDKSTQLIGKTGKGIKEYLIYDFFDVEIAINKKEQDTFIDLINIEEELLNPKWYSDLNASATETADAAQKSSQKYEELVEAVTPFVQFKENVKTNNANITNIKTYGKKANNALKEDIKLEKPTIRKIINQPIAKRRLSIQKVINVSPPQPPPVSCFAPATTAVMQIVQQQPASLQQQRSNLQVKQPAAKKQKIQINTVRNPAAQGVHKSVSSPTQISQSKPLATSSPLIIGSTIKLSNVVINPIVAQSIVNSPQPPQPQHPNTQLTSGPTKEKQTAQILNKLQNLGLQVKRTQPVQMVGNNTAGSSKTDNKTLEILQKLQSKGMKVKILNKQAAGVPKQQPIQVATNTNFNTTHNTIVNTLNKVTPMPMAISASNSAASVSNIKSTFNKNLIIRKVN